MKPHVLRYREFWNLLDGVATEGGHGHAGPVLADWLDEHDSPIRAHIFRHGVPNEPHHDAPEGWGARHAHPHDWVHLKDEDAPRFLSGHPGEVEGDPDRPLGIVGAGPERFELWEAQDPHAIRGRRYVVRHVIHGRIPITASVPTEHLHALADAFEAAHAGGGQKPFPFFRHAAEQQAWSERHAAQLSRVVASPAESIAGGMMHHHEFTHEGKPIGSAYVSYHPNAKPGENHLHVISIGHENGRDNANTLGAGHTRSIFDALVAHYPEATHVTGRRDTGVRAGKADRHVAIPIRRRVQLARMQAAPGGTITNNTYQRGGQFIAKARQRIRDVAAKLVKLARPDEGNYSALVKRINDNEVDFRNTEHSESDRIDPTPNLAFADWLQENEVPGAHVVRAHANTPEHGYSVRTPARLRNLRQQQRTGASVPYFLESPPRELTDPNDLGTAEEPAAQVFANPKRGGVVVAVLHHNPEGNRIVHSAIAHTADELRLLLSDFKPEHRQALFGNLIETGAIRNALSGKGARKFTLARKPASVDVSVKSLFGRTTSGPPMTLGELRKVEEAHGLPKNLRLSNRVTQPADAKGDEHPFNAGTPAVQDFLSDLTDHKIGKAALRAVLRDPKTSSTVKLTHLVTHLGADYSTAEHPAEGGSWYGGQVSHLDRAIHKIAAGGKDHPLWGSMDEKTGELKGKEHPADNHPGLVLLKAVIAATSGNQNPTDNLASALKAWDAGKAAGHPITDMPDYNHEALEQWVRRVQSLHGAKAQTAKAEGEIRNPGNDPHKKAAWYTKWVLPFEDQLAGKGIVGWAAHNARINTKTGRAVWVERNKKIIPVDRRSDTADAKIVGLPFTYDGSLRPKGWGMYGTQVAERLAPLKALFRYEQDRNPRGTPLEHFREVARWLTSEHEPADFDRMANNLKAYKDHFPHLKPHLIESKGLFNKGWTDQKGATLPGMFILGPKFGSFAMNLHSNDPETRVKWRRFLTADKWWTRNFFRYLGDMKESPDPRDRRLMKRAVEELCKTLNTTPADLQADLWYHEKNLYGMLGAGKRSSENQSYKEASDTLLGPTGALRNVKLARTIPHTDPEMRDWWRQIRPESGHFTVDHTAAAVLADRLEELEDWRHHLLRRSATYTPSVGEEYPDDAVTTTNGEHVSFPSNTTFVGPRVPHGTDPYGPRSVVGPAKVIGTGEHRVYVNTLHPRDATDVTKVSELHSVLTPEEYEAMRRDAATAGVHFPQVEHK